jgi:carboxyl-terminal processing protease
MSFPAGLVCQRRWAWVIVGLMVVAGSVTAARCELTGPRPGDRPVAQIVAAKLPKDHLTRHPLDAEISRRMLTLYLRALDPQKMYFYQSDIDSFRQHEQELVEKVKRGDVNPGYTIYSLLIQRVEERVQMVNQLLPIEPDFTIQEDMVDDRDATVWPTTPDEAREKWRKRIKYELLVLKSSPKEKVEGQAARDKLARRYQSFLKRLRQTDAEEMLEMYLTSMTSAYDPHTNYMSPSTVENFDIVMRLDLDGIGASLQSIDGYTVVNKLVPGGAAEKDGRLKVEDKIVGVGQGENGEIVDVVDMKLSDVVKLIRGKRGTVVRLETQSKTAERKVIKIVREKIELKDSEARGQIFDAGRRPDGAPYKVGVIDLPSFYMDMNGAKQGLPNFRSTTRDVHKLLDDFNAKGVDAVVLDLRRNGGGSLTEAIHLTGLFIAQGPVVQVKGSDGRVNSYDDQDPEVAWSGPLVVVTSKFSASASEILAGAIQDYHRGLIVGDHTTHGKGTVQSLLDLGQEFFRIPINASKMGALKITVQQFYRPNGESTQKRGVLADVEIPSIFTHMDVGEADLDYSLPFDRVDPAAYRPYNYVDKPICDQLSAASQQRCAASSDFQKVQRSIARYIQHKESKKVTLNEKAFMEEREELNTEKEEEKMTNPDKLGIERDYYLNEVLAVSGDYLDLLVRGGQMRLAGPQAGVPQQP